MSWKDLQSWIKGGIVELVIAYAGYVALFYYSVHNLTSQLELAGRATIVFSIWDTINFSSLLIFTLVFFGIGALVGKLACNQIKSKKRKK